MSPKYEVTIVATFEVELDNLERDREAITTGYTLPQFPDLIPEDAIEYSGGSITYEEIETIKGEQK